MPKIACCLTLLIYVIVRLTCFKHGDASVKHNGASTDSGGSRRITQSPSMVHNTSSQRMSVNSASHSSSAHNLNNGVNRSNSIKGVITLSFTSGHPSPVFPPDPTDKCSMCLFSFTLFKRAHHCRLCEALCCDECSKKRCLVEYSQVGGCFLFYLFFWREMLPLTLPHHNGAACSSVSYLCCCCIYS